MVRNFSFPPISASYTFLPRLGEPPWSVVAKNSVEVFSSNTGANHDFHLIIYCIAF